MFKILELLVYQNHLNRRTLLLRFVKCKYSHQKEKVHVSLHISVLGLIPAALYSTLSLMLTANLLWL